MTKSSLTPQALRGRGPRGASRIRSRRRERGFTLVELIIAMLAGLLVALSALILSKNATRFFQHEARLATATLAAQLGMNRLAVDLQRAGFLSSPNIAVDPMTCGSLSGVVGLREVASLQIAQGGSVSAHVGELWQSVANGFNPDSVIIGGAFDTVEQFPVRAFIPSGGGAQVYLQTDALAMARTLKAAANGAATLQNIFTAGRFLRIVDVEGHAEWGVIASIAVAPGNPPPSVVITLQAAPSPQQKAAGNICGIVGFGGQSLANPVSRVRYDVRSLFGNAAFPNAQPATASAAQFGANAAPYMTDPLTGDKGNAGNFGRTELVRVELDQNGAEIGTSLEVVAEFAVDLKFGLTCVGGANCAAPPGANPTATTRMPITAGPENASVYALTAPNAWAGGGGQPQRVRALQVRLATRTRSPDRELDIPMAPFSTADGRRYRFLVDANMPGPKYARLRTLYSEVNLPNQVSTQW